MVVDPFRLKYLEEPEMTVKTRDPSASGGDITCIIVDPFWDWPLQTHVKLNTSRDWFRGALYINSAIALVSVVGNTLMAVPGTSEEPA